MKRLLLIAFALVAHDTLACAPNWVQNAKSDFWVEGGVRAADLNNDGRTDIAGVQKWAALIALAGADGKPGAQQMVYEGDYLSDLRIADVQNDGKPDLILSDIALNQLIVLPGNNDGTFGAPVITQLPISATSIVARDFGNDGVIDIAFRSYSASAISVWKGNGAGGFTHLATTPVGIWGAVLAAGDFDDDGFADLATTEASAKIDVYFGNGDGTFDAPVRLTGNDSSNSLQAGDLDGDGDDDIAAADPSTDTMTVFLHTGSRTFNVAIYDAKYDAGSAIPRDVAIADVTQDGHPDIVVALLNARRLATFVGNGNGTFRSALYAPIPSTNNSPMFPNKIVAGRFDDDVRTDVVAVDTGYGYASLFLNNCGASTITAGPVNPVISVGQTATITVQVLNPGTGDLFYYSNGRPIPTGTVHVKNGATDLGQATLDSKGAAQIAITGLAAADHALTIHYDGDEIFDPRDSDPVMQRVTTETTTLDLVVSPANGIGYYGQGIEVHATATPSNGGTPTGLYRLFVDGVVRDTRYFAPPAILREYPDDVGTFEFYVDYSGDENYPPSRSQTYTHTIVKAPVEIRNGYNPAAVRQGQTPYISATIDGQYDYPTGTVQLYDADTLLGTLDLEFTSQAGFNVATANLTVGDHWLHFTYGGDSHFEPATGPAFRLTILPNVPLALLAVAENGHIAVSWMPPGYDPHQYVLQRLINGNWTTIYTTYSDYGSYTESSPAGGVPYIYRVHAFAYDGTLLYTSNVDMARLASFTDDPFAAGVTKIKAVHVTELVSAINAVRAATALAPVSLPNVAPGKTMNALDIQVLRNALNDALTNLGMPAYPFPDILTAKQTLIRAKHLRELRDLLR